LVSLLGDISLDPIGNPALHIHVVVGRRDSTAYGGHLIAAHVRPNPPARVSSVQTAFCLAGLRGLELANVIFVKPLKYWANFRWTLKYFGTRHFSHATCQV
jgi:hypothetical protein